MFIFIKNLLNIFKKKVTIQHFGIKLSHKKKKPTKILWENINTIVLGANFSEYSGFCLTNDHTSKVYYDKIFVKETKNKVSYRDGNRKRVLYNTKKPFHKRFGNTIIYSPFIIDYTLNGKDYLIITSYNYLKATTLQLKLKKLSKNNINIVTLKDIYGFQEITKLK